MQNKVEEDTPLSLKNLKSQFTQFMINCGFFRKNHENQISLENSPKALIFIYKKMIEEINQQILIQHNQLKKAEQFGMDDEGLYNRIENELIRQNKYLEEIKLRLITTEALDTLFSLASNELFEEANNNTSSALLIAKSPVLIARMSHSQVIAIIQKNPEFAKALLCILRPLNPSELLEEAKKNKASALLIAQTPELIAKISDAQIISITHHDPEITKLLATNLASREYTFTIAQIYTSLIEQVKAEPDKHFILKKENEGINQLLLKIERYLDDKIADSLTKKTSPWSLGYFGSHYKLNKAEKKIPVPHGIYELKNHLTQQGKIPPKQILAQIQKTLSMKQKENNDESILKQFKRFVSYIFGCHRTGNTAQEYDQLESMINGKIM